MVTVIRWPASIPGWTSTVTISALLPVTTTTLPSHTRPASSGPKWIGGNMPVARLGLILNLLIPVAFLVSDAFHGKLGADPVKEAIHTTGLVAVTYLLMSLCVTPLKMVTGWGWLIQFRRSLGVFAFYYACAHLLIYFWWDRERSLENTVYEITHRYYLMIGFISLVVMLPLWATSFNGAIKALGGVRWKRFHRWAYVAAGLACWHFYLQTKADKRRPEIYIAILAILLLWRVIAYLAQRRRASVVTVGRDKPEQLLSK
jgi:DMSO/TMAO reductase YedYZ heme-binding membrane subunit